MTEVIKPVSHADDEAFIRMLETFAQRMKAEGNEEMEFVLLKAADKIKEWKGLYEAIQDDLT